MIFLRGIGIIFGGIVCFVLSQYFNINFYNIIACVAFIIAVDTAVVDVTRHMVLTALYSKVAEDMEKDDE